MKKRVLVGGSLSDAAQRVADSWHRAEQGGEIEPTDTITFVSWSALASVMSDRRYELLCHLHRHPTGSIRALARELDRDFKRVHEDVKALESVGLIEREGRVLRADYDVIQASILLDAAAA